MQQLSFLWCFRPKLCHTLLALITRPAYKYLGQLGVFNPKGTDDTSGIEMLLYDKSRIASPSMIADPYQMMYEEMD